MKSPIYPTTNIHQNEPFKQGNTILNFNILEFWKWNQSDLVENRNRGILAEFIVKKALNLPSTTRLEWDNFDFETEDNIKIEVKSAAYIQAWEQSKFSKISFGIAPTRKTLAKNQLSTEVCRQADVYIFCLLHHKDFKTINPMDMEQWTFYLVPTQVLNEKLPTQKSLGLYTLEKIGAKKCSFQHLKFEFENMKAQLNHLQKLSLL